MEGRSHNQEAQVHATNLEYTLKELQRKVREYETELGQLRDTSAHHGALETPAGQARILKTALEDVTTAEPFLPFPGSVLPALLAMRKTHQTIEESKAFLTAQTEAKEKEKRQLEANRANLKEHQLLQDALKSRIQSLKEELVSATVVQPEDGVRKRIKELQKKKQHYAKETSKLMKALNGFIDNHLAAMLAAEELGGPIVGDMMDIDPDDLAAGFNAQGKLKKPQDAANRDKRQRRIDEMWPSNRDAQHDEEQTVDEVAEAGTEMRKLTEELLNRLMEAKGSTSDSYVQLSRETAAARFLIRSKVVQLHPKDATRIRLVDFGRELDD